VSRSVWQHGLSVGVKKEKTRDAYMLYGKHWIGPAMSGKHWIGPAMSNPGFHWLLHG